MAHGCSHKRSSFVKTGIWREGFAATSNEARTKKPRMKENRMYTLRSLRQSASNHNRHVRNSKMIKVSQSKGALLNDMKNKAVKMPAPRRPRGTNRKSGMSMPVAPRKKARRKGTSAMFKTTKSGQVKVRKAASIAKQLFWLCNRAMWVLAYVCHEFHDRVV